MRSARSPESCLIAEGWLRWRADWVRRRGGVRGTIVPGWVTCGRRRAGIWETNVRGMSISAEISRSFFGRPVSYAQARQIAARAA